MVTERIEIKRLVHTEYTRKDRIASKIPKHLGLSKYILKELLDNACDATERQIGQDNIITVTLTLTASDELELAVENIGSLSKEVIENVMSFKYLYSTKHGFKRITRGFIGHGLKLAILASYQEKEKNEFIIESMGKKYIITLHDRFAKNPDEVFQMKEEDSYLPPERTKVSLKLKEPNIYFGLFNIKQYLDRYILCNPHLSFEVIIQRQGQEEKKVFYKTCEVQIDRRADITSYENFNKFEEDLQAVLNYGINVDLRTVAGEFLGNYPDKDFKTAEELYNYLHREAKRVELPSFGKTAFLKRCMQFGLNLKMYDRFTCDGWAVELIVIEEQSERCHEIADVARSLTNENMGPTGDIICGINGCFLPSSAIHGLDFIENELERLGEKNCYLLLVLHCTNPPLYGTNKEYLELPPKPLLYEVKKRLMKKKEKTRAIESSKKGKYAWMIKTEEYRNIIKIGRIESDMLSKPYQPGISPETYFFIMTACEYLSPI